MVGVLGRRTPQIMMRALLAVVLLVQAMLVPLPTAAQTPPQTVTFTPSSVAAGGTILTSGTGWSCDPTVTLDLLDQFKPGDVFPLTRVAPGPFIPCQSWANEEFTVPATVPTGQDRYRVRATDNFRTAISTNLLTVTPAGTITFTGVAQCRAGSDGQLVQLRGVPVQLFSGTGLVATTTSDPNTAAYSFNAAPGRYTVRATQGAVTCGGANPSEGTIITLTPPIDWHNHSWPHAFRLDTLATPNTPVQINEHLFKLDQSAWFKTKVQPGGRIILTLTGLPANYDVTLYKDIGAAFNALTSPQDLTRLQAEFAPDAFSPDAFSPDAFSPDAFSPDAFSPDAFSPDAFSPDAFSPDAFSPDAFSPDAFSPDAFSPDAFSPDKAAPDAFSPDAFSGSDLPISPAAYAGAQTRSLLAISAHNGTASEGIRKFIWDNTGDFYVRVRGRNGAFSLAAPFHLEITQLTSTCSSVSPILGAPSLAIPAGGFHSIFLTDVARLAGSDADKAALLGPGGLMAILAARPEIAGVDIGDGRGVVDIGLDGPVQAARAQADAHPDCPVAKNFLAERIKALTDAARAANPIEYVVLVGSDSVVPYFRSPDQAGLANEKNYVPPVVDASASQASLKLGYVLSQDRYGSSIVVSRGDHGFSLADLAVGRLIETPTDMAAVVNAYLTTANGVVPTPTSALVTGYDFFAQGAAQIGDQLGIGLNNSAAVDRLITPPAWTALDLRNQLLNTRHDIAFVGAHFSQATALSADYATRIFSTDVVNAPADFTNDIIFSEGCHSGYNTVDGELVPGVTYLPDFPQAFASRGATLIAGSGYQYGDTDFIEYGVRLYLEFSKQLRTGTGPVSVGKALVAAKRSYLASTPQMRGIHEKTLLESTLFGLPQLKVDMPGARLAPNTPPSIPTTPVTVDPGLKLGLATADTTVNPTLTPLSKSLRNVGGGPAVTASWFSGADGTLTNPGEPALPLELRGVTGSGAATVLRGVGLRTASYTDTPDITPLTGEPSTEVSSPHGTFAAGTFFPVRPWSVNYYDALAGGATRLAVTPAQYLTNPGDTASRATQRQFSSMTFRLFYSNNTATFGANQPGLAAAPAISKVTGVPNGGSVNFAVNVVGDPSAGIQQVWVTYTAVAGPFAGLWQSVDLQQPARPFSAANPSTLWRGSLPLPSGQNASDVRFIVQAANGVGLVTLDTNLGAYFTPGSDAVSPINPKQQTRLALTAPSSGTYREAVALSARLTVNGTPLPNRPLKFGIGSQRRFAVTDANGSATVNMALLTTPDQYDAEVAFDETPDLLGSSATSPFTVNKAPTLLAFGASPLVVVLTDASVAKRPLRDQTVFFTLSGVGGSISQASITDPSGRAILTNVPLPAGTYNVVAEFLGTPIHLSTSIGTQDINLTSDHFLPATAVRSTLTLNPVGPRCDLTALLPGPPTQLQVTVQDTDRGLLSIIPTEVVNATVSIPTFVIGDTRAQLVTATKIDESTGSRLALHVTNVAGDSTDCDPVILTLGNAPNTPKKATVHDVAASEGLLTLVNGKPGVTAVHVTVNGEHQFEVKRLKDGEKRTIDISAFLHGNNNTITLHVTGKPHGTVTVMISDSPNSSVPSNRTPVRHQQRGNHQNWDLGDD